MGNQQPPSQRRGKDLSHESAYCNPVCGLVAPCYTGVLWHYEDGSIDVMIVNHYDASAGFKAECTNIPVDVFAEAFDSKSPLVAEIKDGSLVITEGEQVKHTLPVTPASPVEVQGAYIEFLNRRMRQDHERRQMRSGGLSIKRLLEAGIIEPVPKKGGAKRNKPNEDEDDNAGGGGGAEAMETETKP